MTIQKVVDYLIENNPKTAIKMRRHFKMRFIGAGSFRRVYKVYNLPLVIKFPKREEQDKRHADREINNLSYLKGTDIERYLPKVYYTNLETGVVAMRWYKKCPPRKLVRAFHEKHHCELDCDELDYCNLGTTPKGRIKIIDVGMF